MLNCAVIGIGNMGRHHARVYSEIANLVAIADMDSIKGKEIARHYNCKYYSDYLEMITTEKIDCLSIAVPNILHKKIALDCMAKGINVLIEKPIADTLENASAIIKASMGLKVTVGHIERFNPVVRELKKIIESGDLGDITSIIAKRVGLFPPQIKDSNVIVDLAVHDIDICSYLLGAKPSVVNGFHGKALAQKEDYAEIFLRYGKVNVVVQANWITPIKIRSIAITGTLGYVEANYITQKIDMYKRSFHKDFNDFGDFVLKFGEPEKTAISVEQKEPLKEELISFLKSVRENVPVEVTLDEAFNALEVALKASK